MKANFNKYLNVLLVFTLVLSLLFTGLIFFYINSFQKNKGKELAVTLDKLQDQKKSYPEYIWVQNTDNKTFYPYTLFKFRWEQQNLPSEAFIKLSCLGRYQLLINGQRVYHGPNFALLPDIYYDQIDLKDKVKIGENYIDVVCNYFSYPVHEHPTYSSLAMLVGGKIADGSNTHFLADPNRWFSAGVAQMQNGTQISNTSGYSEVVSLPLNLSNLTEAAAQDLKEYRPKKNPLPLLTLSPQPLVKISKGVYDLGSFMVGFLQIKSSADNKCSVKVTWGGKLDANNKVIPYFNQEDQTDFQAGVFVWNQFSRRAGRYIQIDAPSCLDSLSINFQRQIMPFSKPVFTNLPSEVDRKIYKMSVNTLLNNVQNHIEDSVEREKAMYIGDSLTVSTCLLQGVGNENFVKEMIKQFAQSQIPDGRIPSMAPSGAWQFIPGYHLQWIVWLDLYLSKSKDKQFAKEMYPSVQKALEWAFAHESADGFIFNKENEEWWNFIDWTPIDNKYKYSTALQAWYFKALNSAASISVLAGEDDTSYKSKATTLRVNLQKKAYDEQTEVFADSFDETSKAAPGLVTNALAGKFGLFENAQKESQGINYFGFDLSTVTPYSEAWVVEWLIDAGRKDQALSTMRKYWGAMADEGMTSLFESYSPTLSPKGANGERLIPNTSITSSFSHGWGCGPVFLYPKIFN